VVTLCVICAALAAAAWTYRRATNVERVAARLAAELPPGPARADVEAWLDRHHFCHAPVTSAEPVLFGELQDVPVDWLLDGDIDVYFSFDAEGRLVSQMVEAYPMSL
jgi:hypothetical protein